MATSTQTQPTVAVPDWAKPFVPYIPYVLAFVFFYFAVHQPLSVAAWALIPAVVDFVVRQTGFKSYSLLLQFGVLAVVVVVLNVGVPGLLVLWGSVAFFASVNQAMNNSLS